MIQSIVLFLCCLGALPAQSAPGGSIDGRVIDPAGEPIPGASVSAHLGQSRAVGGTTDAEGRFSLPLPPGAYTLRVSAEGFDDAALAAGATSVVVQLHLRPQRDVVTVSETAPVQPVATGTATKTPTLLVDLPESISIVSGEQMKDRMMSSIGDVVRYVPGVTAIQGENNRDQVVIRGNSSSADFFVNGFRDDVQYYRDLYNIERLEALKGPNAMIFGRGGGGGVINRVTKEPAFTGLREIDLQAGAFGNKRIATDYDHPFGDKAAFRINGMYENSGSFRDRVGLERYGINPGFVVALTPRTHITLNYEHFHDGRTADRGIPSYEGRPADIPVSTFFGNPEDSWVRAAVDIGTVTIERQWGSLNLRNRALAAGYDRAYQNYVPGAVNADQTLTALSAYNNATGRRNLFNQTDFTYSISTGRLRHTLLWGAEAGRQATDNFRNTGYFNNIATSILIPYASPTVSTPTTFRQSTTDADNRVLATVAAGYVQDQVELTRFIQLVAGVRFDRFDLHFENHRNADRLRHLDRLVSPRAGVVLKPASTLSVYWSYSVSFLPSSGDQFSSLTSITQQVKPERFTNYEAGVKWDLRRSLSLTTAVYRLDRTNTRATDPNDPARIVQTGSQRTDGVELGIDGALTGKWRVSGGYAWQNAFISSPTVAARLGAHVAQVPRHTFSLWNSYRILPRLTVGLGVLNRTSMYAAVDNAVTLPGYARADVAAYYSVTERVRFQVNVENLLDRRYYLNADGNNNISPGSPRAVRAGLVARF